MGWTIGIPSLKLNNVGTKSKHCGNFRSVAEEALLERKGHDPDINPELSSKNRYDGYRTAAELIDYSDNHCSTMKDSRNRALRKDAVRMCVTIIKPPAAYMATLTEEEHQRFLQDRVAQKMINENELNTDLLDNAIEITEELIRAINIVSDVVIRYNENPIKTDADTQHLHKVVDNFNFDQKYKAVNVKCSTPTELLNQFIKRRIVPQIKVVRHSAYGGLQRQLVRWSTAAVR